MSSGLHLVSSRSIPEPIPALVAMQPKAPLCRIVSRDLQIWSHHPNGQIYQFGLYDLLECGHEQPAGYLTFSDLINPYSESSAMRARRHRCRECAAIVASRKPVSSVALSEEQKVVTA